MQQFKLGSFFHLLHRAMVNITRDEIPLSDEPKLRALIKSLRLKKLKRKPLKPVMRPKEEKDSRPTWAPFDGPDELSRDAREKFEAYTEAAKRLSVHRAAERAKAQPALVPPPEAPRFLREYFLDCVPRRVWLNRESISIQVSFLEGVLRRVVITGLKDEKEANAVWLEAAYHRARGETLEQIAERVVSDTEREAREHHHAFLHHLQFVRDYFTWRNGEAVASDGRVLPIGRSGLRDDDIELLRQVYTRLRYKSSKVPDAWYPALGIEEESCPTCGGAAKPKAKPLKKRSEAIKRVKELSREYADAGFDAWVSLCLQTKTEKWTRSTPLYAHYAEWVRKGGHGQNRTERGAAKATALSQWKWGQLMRARFPQPDACKQDKHSVLYRAVPKRAA